MKIETKKIVEFLKTMRMDDIESCLLDFDDTGLNISVFSQIKDKKVDARLFKTEFLEYAAIGKIGVDDISKLINVFKRLGDEVEFSVEGNLMTAKGKKNELSFELVDEKYIDAIPTLPEMTFATSFKIKAEEMIEAINDAVSNKDFKIIIETVDDGVKISNTGKYRFTRNVDSKGTKGGERVEFGMPLVNIFSNINKTEDIECRVKTDYIMEIEYKNKSFSMKFLASPFIDKQ